MKLCLTLASVCTALVCTAPAFAQDLIIETRPGGKNFDRFSETRGTWRDSDNPVEFAKSEAEGLTPQGQVGTRTFILPKNPGADTDELLASARFMPAFQVPVRCHVYVTWPRGANAAPVRYVVRHAGGSDTVSLSQNGFGFGSPGNSGVWIPLGEYEFTPAGDQYVEVRVFSDARAVDTRTPGRAYCDAVRFAVRPVVSAGQNAAAVPSLPRTAASAAEEPFRWLDSVAEGLARAGRDNRKILVFFYSPTSDRSLHYEEEVFSNPAVRSLLRDRFVAVRVNMQKESDLSARMRAFKAGTINLYDSRGAGLGQFVEPLTVEELAAKLQALQP